MKTLKTILTVFVVITAISILAYAQPTTPKEEIPKDIQAKVRELIERLDSADAKERKKAAYDLRAMGEKAVAAVPFLIELLNDKDSKVTRAARSALEDIGKPAVEPLIALLKNKSTVNRTTPASILGKIKDPRAIEALILLLKDENNHYVRNTTLKSLKKITEEDFGEDEVKWRAWWDENKEKLLKQQ